MCRKCYQQLVGICVGASLGQFERGGCAGGEGCWLIDCVFQTTMTVCQTALTVSQRSMAHVCLYMLCYMMLALLRVTLRLTWCYYCLSLACSLCDHKESWPEALCSAVYLLEGVSSWLMCTQQLRSVFNGSDSHLHHGVLYIQYLVHTGWCYMMRALLRICRLRRLH